MENLLTYKDRMIDMALGYGPKVILALLVLGIGFWSVRMIVRVMDKALEKAKVDSSLRTFLRSATRLSLRVIVIIIVVSVLGVETTSLVAMISAAGIAIGLALKGNLSNLAGGILILLMKPFKVDDWIEVQGHIGRVVQIQVFHTVMLTPDNRRVLIPNGPLSEGNIINITAEPIRRVDLKFGISYRDDMGKAAGILRSVIAVDDRIHEEPEPLVAVSELGDSSVNFTVRVWCNTLEYWNVFFDIHQKVKEAFDGNGISIPFPQTDVHLFKPGE